MAKLACWPEPIVAFASISVTKEKTMKVAAKVQDPSSYCIEP